MSIGSNSKDYWVLRLGQAVEDAIRAPTDRSRVAYLELARHYWLMHVMINGQQRPAAMVEPKGGCFHAPDLRQAA